jgi:hypothetical protein
MGPNSLVRCLRHPVHRRLVRPARKLVLSSSPIQSCRTARVGDPDASRHGRPHRRVRGCGVWFIEREHAADVIAGVNHRAANGTDKCRISTYPGRAIAYVAAVMAVAGWARCGSHDLDRRRTDGDGRGRVVDSRVLTRWVRCGAASRTVVGRSCQSGMAGSIALTTANGFVAVSDDGAWSSPDGRTWSQVAAPPGGLCVVGVGPSGSLAVGDEAWVGPETAPLDFRRDRVPSATGGTSSTWRADAASRSRYGDAGVVARGEEHQEDRCQRGRQEEDQAEDQDSRHRWLETKRVIRKHVGHPGGPI